MIEYLIGVDGGGSGTRALLARPDGTALGRGDAGPSALGQGVPQAWRNIESAVRAAFADAKLALPAWDRCALGAGLSGASNARWREEFLAGGPGIVCIALETDSFTTLLGAHAGKPGAIVIAGTGSVGEVIRADGARVRVGGWGFPVGDEGSGAWLGLRAMRLAQAAMDGRRPAGEMARRIFALCGDDRDSLQAWCSAARQFEYAQLAPLVFDTEAVDADAAILLGRAVAAIEETADALDPGGMLPLAIHGSIGTRLAERFRPAVRRRCVAPAGDATQGALNLIQQEIEATTR